MKTLVIAEAGVNHNGSLETAKDLIKTAKLCGADVVKFQTAKLDSLVSKTAHMAEYQKENIGKEESQKEMLSKLLLPFEDFFCDALTLSPLPSCGIYSPGISISL